MELDIANAAMDLVESELTIHTPFEMVIRDQKQTKVDGCWIHIFPIGHDITEPVVGIGFWQHRCGIWLYQKRVSGGPYVMIAGHHFWFDYCNPDFSDQVIEIVDNHLHTFRIKYLRTTDSLTRGNHGMG